MKRQHPAAYPVLAISTSDDMDGETLLQGISLACRFFAWLFCNEPTTVFLRTLHEQNLLKDWPMPAASPAARQGLALLQDFLEQPEDVSLKQARREYTDLFIGPEQPLMLWESAWTTKDKLLFGDPAIAVRACYARHGMAAPGPDPDDHIALELSFIGELLEQRTRAIDAGNAVAAKHLRLELFDFYTKHLALWGEQLLQEMERRATTGLYRGTALLCAETLRTLAELFTR